MTNGIDGNNEHQVDEEEENEQDWSGVPITDIPCLGPGSKLPSHYPAPVPGPDHTVCVQLPASGGEHKPHPQKLRDVWDERHVRLPWSRENQYQAEDKKSKGKKVLRSKWDLIIESLTKVKLSSSKDLEKAIMSYNQHYSINS